MMPRERQLAAAGRSLITRWPFHLAGYAQAFGWNRDVRDSLYAWRLRDEDLKRELSEESNLCVSQDCA